MLRLNMVWKVTNNSIYNIYNNIYNYIKDSIYTIYNTILQRTLKYLLLRSKYLKNKNKNKNKNYIYNIYNYIKYIKNNIKDSIDTKQVIDSIPKLDVFIDGTSYLDDEEYFSTIERLNTSINVGGKDINKKDIPKAYELVDLNKLKIGEMDDFNIYGEMGQLDDSVHGKGKVHVQRGVDPASDSKMEK